MPLDGKGTMRHNFEVARAHSPERSREGMSSGDASENVHEVVDHGDGTFTTRHPEHGEVHHESIGHMHAHLSKHHGEDGHEHFHAHHDGAGMHHSHHVASGGEPDHREHDGLDGVHEHMDEKMGGEEEEPAEVARVGGDGEEDGLY